MRKIRRNDPCPCGSGKKYKQCCLEQDELIGRAEREASNAALAAEVEATRVAMTQPFHRLRESEDASAAVWALIEAKRFDEAETAARAHIERFTETPTGFELMALLKEARGDAASAIQWTHKVIDLMRSQPAVFTPKDQAQFRRRIERLSRASASPGSTPAN